ncbi:hypothetical protein ACFQX6_31400 [Streptosporangium lutulentum]
MIQTAQLADDRRQRRATIMLSNIANSIAMTRPLIVTMIWR